MAYILIVDDQKYNNRLMARSLVMSGHRVTVVADPMAVEGAIKDDPPDLAIVDVLFPASSWTGLDVLETLKRVAPEAKRIISTEGGDQRSLELTAAIERFDPEGLVMKEEESLGVAIKSVLAGLKHKDPGMVAYLVAEGARSPDALVAHESHRNLWLALSEGHTSTRELADRTGYTKKYVEKQTAKMREILWSLQYVTKPELSLHDLAGYAEANKLFFRNEYRRRNPARANQ